MHLTGVAETFTPTLPCLCASFRRASRALTSLYDEALRPVELRATQFTVLQALSIAGEVTQGALGRMLAMDSTTLTRTLGIMVRHRWIARRPGEDRREWRIQLSKAGETLLNRALPYWNSLQTQLRTQLGNEVWENLLKLTDTVTNAVTE
ncbi:MAG TPA: MarR family transcriptional regulator [Bryobacteraceae bacterium]|jgi:DNA-binding MarR family transcriptional regulator|nr:MarR family transcriptional regulator [Bryobacteraceae bacterium]